MRLQELCCLEPVPLLHVRLDQPVDALISSEIALSLLGADPRVAEILPSLLRAITASMGRHPEQAAEDSPDEPDVA